MIVNRNEAHRREPEVVFRCRFCSTEPGSPTILLDDAALDRAIPSALTMAFLNSGQACAAGTRLLVPKSRLDDVKEGIRETMRAFGVGDPADPKTAIGPMVSQKLYDRVQAYGFLSQWEG